MSSQPERVQAVVRGRVQGVNFRAATQRAAARLGLHGWVGNQSDGTVAVAAEGPRAALESLVAWLHQGPPAAQVTAVETAWLPARGEFAGFEIRW
jgi:acylphosphatase